MSTQAPPTTVQIKRKREDEPVDSLFVERTGLPAEFHYRLLSSSKSRKTASSSSPGRPPKPPKASFRTISKTAQHELDQYGVPIVHSSVPQSTATRPLPATTPKTKPHTSSLKKELHKDAMRHYRLKPPSTATATKRRRDADDVATFVEKKQRTAPRISVQNLEEPNGVGKAPATSEDGRDTRESRPLKRPVRRAASGIRTSSVASTRSGREIEAQPSVEDLKTYMELADEVVAADKAEQKRIETPKSVRPIPKSVFENAANGRLAAQPRSFVPRHRDRHPEMYADPTAKESDSMDLDLPAGESDDEYVYDTYVRELVPAVNADTVGSFGWVVIEDEDQEAWDFYADSEEEVEDYNSDEDDENAENYYGADYPEDEVDSADEFDRDPYSFRRGASDQEEWDADRDASDDDGMMSDADDDDDLRFPWRKYNHGATVATRRVV